MKPSSKASRGSLSVSAELRLRSSEGELFLSLLYLMLSLPWIYTRSCRRATIVSVFEMSFANSMPAATLSSDTSWVGPQRAPVRIEPTPWRSYCWGPRGFLLSALRSPSAPRAPGRPSLELLGYPQPRHARHRG